MHRQACFFGSLALSALIWGGLVQGVGRADPIFTTSGTNGSDGPVAASIDFQAIAGGIEITVTNTLPVTDTIDKGEAISAFSFNVSGLSSPTAFYQLSGSKVDSSTFVPGQAFPGNSTVTSFTDTPTNNQIDHWSLNTTGADVVASAGPTAPGMNPIYMILPSSGITGPGSSLADGHFDPYILGAGHFFLTDPGITATTILTSSNFTNVTVGFGTGPDVTLNASPEVNPNLTTPEPASMTLLATGAVSMLGFGWFRRKRITA
jgi:hypothetical protein